MNPSPVPPSLSSSKDSKPGASPEFTLITSYAKQRLMQAQAECKAQRSFAPVGNMYFAAGAAAGATLSFLSPNYWPKHWRLTPFFLSGFAGIFIDNYRTIKFCTKKYPIPEDSQIKQLINMVGKRAEEVRGEHLMKHLESINADINKK
jgi:hypothetical protein